MAARNLAVVLEVAVALEAVEDAEDLVVLVVGEESVSANGCDGSGKVRLSESEERARRDEPMISKLSTVMNLFSLDVEASLI